MRPIYTLHTSSHTRPKFGAKVSSVAEWGSFHLLFITTVVSDEFVVLSFALYIMFKLWLQYVSLLSSQAVLLIHSLLVGSPGELHVKTHGQTFTSIF